MSGQAAFGPGALALEVETVREADGLGRVISARVVSTRPIGWSTAVLAGRPAAEVPGLVGRLHALCGRSHEAASAVAILAATGGAAEAEAARRRDGLLAERIGEHLRSLALGPAAAGADEAVKAALPALRRVLAATRRLDGDGPGRAEAVAEIAEGVAALGLEIAADGRVRMGPGSLAAVLAARAEGPVAEVYPAADALTAADDGHVIAALAADPGGFAAAPRLAGRRPETGPFARLGGASGVGGATGGAARIAARLAEVAEAAADLAGGDQVAAPIDFGRLDDTTGYAAVESPRGRLHHLVRLDGERIASHAILAPTEWNFGPDGPFVATLSAARLAPGAAGRATVERIAAAFDPCVGWTVEVKERADA